MNSKRTLAVIAAEGFVSTVTEYPDGRVEFTADADICADGANGQHGARAAYLVDDKGSDYLANGGMSIRNGKVVGWSPWFRDVAILGEDGQPKIFPGGIIASKTAYRYPSRSLDDPLAYVDSETVAYMVVPPVVIHATRGAVLGCRCRVTNTQNGRISEGMVADVGPRNKVGELSIQMARELGIPESPRAGGGSRATIKYELWPGMQSNDVAARLLRADGGYLCGV